MSDQSNADIYPFTSDPDSPESIESQRRRYEYFRDHPDYNSVRQALYEKVHGKGAWYNKAQNVAPRDDLSPGATRSLSIASESQVNAVRAELATYRRHADALTNLLFCLLMGSLVLNIVGLVIIYKLIL